MARRTTPKTRFRDGLKTFAEQTLDSEFDKLDNIRRSNVMTRFYVTEILNVINPGFIPNDPEDLDACFVDGSMDVGVDFICRTEGRVGIIQTKFHGRSGGKQANEEETFGHFRDVLNRLHPNRSTAYKKNQRLAEIVEDIDWKNDIFTLQYLTLTKTDTKIRDLAERGHINVTEDPDLLDRVDIELLDEEILNEKLREAISATEGVQGPTTIRFSASGSGLRWLSYENANNTVSYIGCISSAQLYELFKTHRYKLFSMNIRNYVGDTVTNKGIIHTVVNDPDDFFFFNNGISAIATNISVDRDGDSLQCTNFSIINGGQTVRSVAKGFKKSDDAKRATVLIRISEVSYKPADRPFLEKITRFNNTQNAIKISDFISNHPTQVDLSRHFSRMARDGKKFWYKNKRTGDRKQDSIPINLEEFAKTIHSFDIGPPDCYGGQPYLFDLQRGYTKVFGDGTQVWENVSKEDFRRLAGIWFLCENGRDKVKGVRESLIKDEEKSLSEDSERRPVVKTALERRWLFFYALGEMFRLCHPDTSVQTTLLQRMYNPQWWTKHDEVLIPYIEMACDALINAYEYASSMPSFVHRNWFRDTHTLSALKSSIARSRTYPRVLNPILD